MRRDEILAKRLGQKDSSVRISIIHSKIGNRAFGARFAQRICESCRLTNSWMYKFTKPCKKLSIVMCLSKARTSIHEICQLDELERHASQKQRKLMEPISIVIVVKFSHNVLTGLASS